MLVAVTLIGLLAISLCSLMSMTNLNTSTNEIADVCMPSIIAAEEMNTALSDVRTQEFKHIISQSQEEMEGVNESLNELADSFENLYTQYITSLVSTDEDRNLVEEIKSDWESYLAAGEEMIQLSAKNKTDQAMAIMTGDHMSDFNDLSEKCQKLVEYNKTVGDNANIAADATYATAQRTMIAILVGLTIIIILAAVYIVVGITKPVSEMDHVAQKIADGQLNETITYQSKDELGVLAVNFNKTVARLREYVDYIDEISKVLDQIAGGNLVFELSYDYAGEFA